MHSPQTRFKNPLVLWVVASDGTVPIFRDVRSIFFSSDLIPIEIADTNTDSSISLF